MQNQEFLNQVVRSSGNFEISMCQILDVGRVHEGAVYESNMSIESYIESGRLSHAISPMPDWFFGTFYTGDRNTFGQTLCMQVRSDLGKKVVSKTIVDFMLDFYL